MRLAGGGTVVAGGAAGVTVQLRDRFGNAVQPGRADAVCTGRAVGDGGGGTVELTVDARSPGTLAAPLTVAGRYTLQVRLDSRNGLSFVAVSLATAPLNPTHWECAADYLALLCRCVWPRRRTSRCAAARASSRCDPFETPVENRSALLKPGKNPTYKTGVYSDMRHIPFDCRCAWCPPPCTRPPRSSRACRSSCWRELLTRCACCRETATATKARRGRWCASRWRSSRRSAA